MPYDMPVMGQGNMKQLTPEDQIRDDNGFTNPNLHRRIHPHQYEGELDAREYNLAIQGVNSYRTTKYPIHDEDSITSDIP